jgi:hypothetical protein
MLFPARKEDDMAERDRIVAICGIACSECPAYVATVNDDDEKRRQTAGEWSKAYNADLKPESINCMSCLSEDGPVFHHCTVCEIRKCGMAKGVPNCAHCDEYACEKLTALLEMVPAARTTLDEIRQAL